MRAGPYLVLVVAVSAVSACTLTPRESVDAGHAAVGGGAPSKDLHPSVAFIAASDEAQSEVNSGSGVIIGPHLVLTAAHVIKNDPFVIVVRPGALGDGENITEGLRLAVRHYVHPGYQAETSQRMGRHDVALLITDGEPFSATQIAAIGSSSDTSETQTFACGYEMVGYGSSGDTGGSETRRAASVCITSPGFFRSVTFRAPAALGFLETKPPDQSERDYLAAEFRFFSEGEVRTREFVPSDNDYIPFADEPSTLPSGYACHGDSGGGIFRISDGALVGILTGAVPQFAVCDAQKRPGLAKLAVSIAVDITRYPGWIASVAQGIVPENDPDCARGQDHTCARGGVPDAPSCGFLAAQLYGWKVLHVPPAAEFPEAALSERVQPPSLLTPQMIQTNAKSPYYVTDQQLNNWHALHGWRLQCDQSGGSPLASQSDGWVRLDGHVSASGFPGPSPVAANGTWDCLACYMWRGD
ncbi:MAG: trypsin-like serine protease [Myxococcales bacterium]|nr:trypsin-like serine protease [Myxococcales bacterium]